MCAIHIMNKQLPLTVPKTWQTIALMLLLGMYLYTGAAEQGEQLLPQRYRWGSIAPSKFRV